jgi:(2Fe-2S) ferredoxin
MSENTKAKNLYECHVFVCTNKKEGGRACCADKGSQTLKDELKTWATKTYGKRIRINNSGCLHFCEQGIVTVIYPEGDWHLNLKSADIEVLKAAIAEKMGPS